VIVPDSTVRAVSSFSHADGALEAAAFLDLDDGALSVNRAYQGAIVGNELWFTDDVLNRITRWNRFGTVQLGAIDLAPHRARGRTVAFGSVWVCAGTPGATQDYLIELTTTGNIVMLHPMPGFLNSVVAHGSQLLVSDGDHADILWVDPATGAVSGVFHDSDGVTGIDGPGQLQSLPNGNVLAGGGLFPVGFYEFDAQGNQVAYVDTNGVPGASGVRGVHRLANGQTLISSLSTVQRYDPLTGQFTPVVSSLTSYYFSLVPSIPLGVSSCGPAVPNTSGRSATINAVGSTIVGDQALRLVVQELPVTTVGLFLASMDAAFVANPGGSQGNLCLGGAIGRFNNQVAFSANDGFFSITVDTAQVPQPSNFVALMPGQTWHFQCWYRDQIPQPSSNFTDATIVTFQ